MNYYNRYINFVKSRPQRVKVLNDGLEVHHIIPRSLGGDNDTSNLVALTPREHFICHIMLTKCYTGLARSKMVYALYRLAHGNGFEKKLTARRYEVIRRMASKNQSERMTKWFKENKEKYMESLKNRNIDWELHKQAHNTPQFKKKMSNLMSNRMSDPIYKARWLKGIHDKDYDAIFTPELRKRMKDTSIKNSGRRIGDIKSRPICGRCDTNPLAYANSRLGRFRTKCSSCEKELSRR